MKLFRWIATLTGFAALVFAVGFLAFVNAVQPADQPAADKADGIVVLTGGTERIAHGLRLLDADRATRLLISGVNPRTTRNTLARRTPKRAHLFRCCVDMGYEARDTVGNADETRQWVKENKFTSLLVVTSSYHMPRSLVELKRALPGIVLHPAPVQSRSVPIRSWYANPGTAKLLFWEYVKFLPAATRYAVVRMMTAKARDGTLRADTLISS